MVLQYAFHIILIIWPIYTLASVRDSMVIAQRGCVSRCGTVDIPYPFGIKGSKCYAHKWFEIECRVTSQGKKPYLKTINMEVTSIDNMHSKIAIMNPIYRWNCHSKDARQVIDLKGSPFVYSHEDNIFLVVGCNNLAILQSNGSEVGGCVSFCENDEQVNVDLNLGSDGCQGMHCCQSSLPKYLSEYNPIVDYLITNKSMSDQCSHALIVREDWQLISSYLHDFGGDLKNLSYVSAVLEWEIRDSNFQPPTDVICYDTNVTYSQNKQSGQRCECNVGFHGNPYIVGGCIAIKGVDSKTQPMWSIIGVLASLGIVILFFALWWLNEDVRKRIMNKRKENFFKQNGGFLLQQRLSSGEVNIDKVKVFSLKDLEKATDQFNMNRILGKGGQGTVYKGMLEDGKIVAVKKFKVQGKVEEFINEFVILSQINHRNVVKLLGCCLEIKIPLLVYEFIPNGNLFEYLHEQNEDLPMTWDIRLRIAAEVAGALFYLHSAASQPIYHRDIKSTNILLDEKYRVKVADFGTSRMVSIEDTHLTTCVQGTFGYLDPEYFHRGQFTEKSDVYSFGVVLVELLTGQRPISWISPEEAKSLVSYFVFSMEEKCLFDIIENRVMKEGKKEHIDIVANLAYRCLDLNGKKRPTMKEVTMELEEIRRLERKSSNAQQNNAEIGLIGNEEYQGWNACSTSIIGPTLNYETPSSAFLSILSNNC